MIVEEPAENYKTGWIKIWRSTANKAWFGKGDYLKLWVYLLMQATHKEMEYLWNGKVITLKPGQFVTGRDRIAKDISCHRSSVERMLTFFEKTEQQIEQQKSNTSRLISIVNYDAYQNSEQQFEQPLSNERATNEQPLSTKQEHKNYKNDKNITTYSVSEKLKFILPFSDTINKSLRFRNTHNLKEMQENFIKNFQDNGKTQEEILALAEETICADAQKYVNFMQWINTNAPRVNQMKDPFSIKQYIEARKIEIEKLKDLLKSMHNYEPLIKKNRSASLTLGNWLKRRTDGQ